VPYSRVLLLKKRENG